MPKASILYDYKGNAFSRFFDENRIALPTDKPVPKLRPRRWSQRRTGGSTAHGAIDPSGCCGRRCRIFPATAGARAGARSRSNWPATASGGWSGPMTANSWKFSSRTASKGYMKEQILRYYLDRIYFGQGLYGAETTAYAFFGCRPQVDPSAVRAARRDDLEPERVVAVEGHQRGPKAARDRAPPRWSRRVYHPGRGGLGRAKPLALRPRPDFGGGFATSEVRRQSSRSSIRRWSSRGG